jgi:isoleucyl-tRNA synthetase
MTAPDYRPTVFLPKTDFPMKAGLPEREPQILSVWQAADLYTQLREARAGRPKFIFHDGPPYANGDMHIGHALNHILKDAVMRPISPVGIATACRSNGRWKKPTARKSRTRTPCRRWSSAPNAALMRSIG